MIPRIVLSAALYATTALAVCTKLEDCPQFEDVAVDYVRGMVYFLTGNCHIRWDKC